jgi:hypothetical protein
MYAVQDVIQAIYSSFHEASFPSIICLLLFYSLSCTLYLRISYNQFHLKSRGNIGGLRCQNTITSHVESQNAL